MLLLELQHENKYWITTYQKCVMPSDFDYSDLMTKALERGFTLNVTPILKTPIHMESWLLSHEPIK